jgi:hypothetical protein
MDELSANYSYQRGKLASKCWESTLKKDPFNPVLFALILDSFPENPSKDDLLTVANRFGLTKQQFGPNKLAQHFLGTESDFALVCCSSAILNKLCSTSIEAKKRQDAQEPCKTCHKCHDLPQTKRTSPAPISASSSQEEHLLLDTTIHEQSEAENKSLSTRPTRRATKQARSRITNSTTSKRARIGIKRAAPSHIDTCYPCLLGTPTASDSSGGRGHKSIELSGHDWSPSTVLTFFTTTCLSPESHDPKQMDALLKSWAANCVAESKELRKRLKSFAHAVSDWLLLIPTPKTSATATVKNFAAMAAREGYYSPSLPPRADSAISFISNDSTSATVVLERADSISSIGTFGARSQAELKNSIFYVR